ncbi:translation initiation factor 2 [Pseudomonas frederiksbergensis]|uniref:Translation initiation factor 2 n=1 Tax=Pseudomonas frederiksbergensis TaxID=104087 RepID=A0A423KJY6_9PSED|nr:translation initiation factor 2 [Pseudomonas frederiksbergensis]RON53585.1 translation initiation factor 2 [Pseudomonas frederiksbergensis]
MKPIFSAAWLSICLVMTVLPEGVMAAAAQEKPVASSSQATAKKPVAAKKATPAKKKAAPIKKRPPIASKSKSASEVVKTTQLPPANLDLSLPKQMVEELKPKGTVPLPKHDGVLPQMFGDKSSDFQLNGRLLSNEMQLQLRNEERREVEGAALEFEFKR